MPIFIIEHLELKLYKWCFFEYERMSNIVGKENLWFTNVRDGANKLRKIGRVFGKSVSELDLKDCCVLDMESPTELKPSDAKKFKYFVFGGILGDYPPRKRTKKELTSRMKGVKSYNIGKEQFSTDTAVQVVYKIFNGEKIKDMDFVDSPAIRINKIEEIVLPFRYPRSDGKASMSSKVVDYLKRKKGF